MIISGYSDHAVSDTRLMPKTGFLATAKDVWSTLTTDAKIHLTQFIKTVCKATVMAGSKGTAK